MSTDPPSPSLRSKPQRVLACVLCQQRKVKCDRKSPCANCVRSEVECVQGHLAQRPRRRRFPERALLERLRKYENLLRQNDIPFEPLHKVSGQDIQPVNAESGSELDGAPSTFSGADASSYSATPRPQRPSGAKNVWHAMSQAFRDIDSGNDSIPDDVREAAVQKVLDQSVVTDDNLLFGSVKASVDLSALHPDPAQIFRLWQIYLDNVNPLLKVTHTPSLQGRMIEAASNIATIQPALEALMFSIYCMSILSLTTEDCQTMFGSSSKDLLQRYQFGCQQALLRCGFLRSHDRECLTALYLYLVSIRPSTVPQSLSSFLGVAIRIAQRMGIHSESTLAKCSPFEAEMRRRLWWSLVLFDTRVGEMSNFHTVTLDPTWDCRVPLNANDSDLRPGLKKLPTNRGQSTDAIFVAIRGEIGQFTRHSGSHLDFTNPALKPIAENHYRGIDRETSDIDKLEARIEGQYFRSCDQENPLHFVTNWTAQRSLAKARLMEHHSRFYGSSVSPTDQQLDSATSHALRILQCDTKIMTSSLTKGFRWLNHLYFPFPAYIQILEDLRKRPSSEEAGRAWEVMSDNCEAWFGSHSRDEWAFFKLFAETVLRAWEACEAASRQSGQTTAPARIVTSIRVALEQRTHRPQNLQENDTEQLDTVLEAGTNDFPMSMSQGLAGQSLPDGLEILQEPYIPMGPGVFSGMPAPPTFHAYLNPPGWPAWSARSGWAGW